MTPGEVGPERLAEIVDGAVPRSDEERAFVALMEETRSLEPGASEELRRRVLDGPPPRPASARFDPRRWLGSPDGRRRILLGAPVVAGAIALAIAIPVLDDGPRAPLQNEPPVAAAVPEGSGRLAAPESASGAAPALQADGASSSAAPASGSGDLNVVPPSAEPRRAQQVTATTRVQVRDVTALSRASSVAMTTVRNLKGFTASSDYSVPNGSEGTNRLVFRVPVARAEDALAAFGRLGVVTGQSANIVDLTTRLTAETTRVEQLEIRVAELRARLAGRPGDAILAGELARAEATLRGATKARELTVGRTRLATLRLTLTTEGPPDPAVAPGRFWGPISRAGGNLADAIAWTLGAVILVGPFMLLAAAAAWGALRVRARSTRRLMGSA